MNTPKPLKNPDFSYLIAIVESSTKEIEQFKYDDEDNMHYIYEAAIEAIYGKTYWLWLNEVIK